MTVKLLVEFGCGTIPLHLSSLGTLFLIDTV